MEKMKSSLNQYLDYRITDQYNENNIEDFLIQGHAFSRIS